jgi:hypothetical protein
MIRTHRYDDNNNNRVVTLPTTFWFCAFHRRVKVVAQKQGFYRPWCFGRGTQ